MAAAPTDEIKLENNGLRALRKPKREFGFKKANWLVRNRKFSHKCYDNFFYQRHTLTSLKQTDELLVEGISEQSIGYLNACCSLKSIKTNDLVTVLIQAFIEQQNTDKMFTHTPICENVVNRG